MTDYKNCLYCNSKAGVKVVVQAKGGTSYATIMCKPCQEKFVGTVLPMTEKEKV